MKSDADRDEKLIINIVRKLFVSERAFEGNCLVQWCQCIGVNNAHVFMRMYDAVTVFLKGG